MVLFNRFAGFWLWRMLEDLKPVDVCRDAHEDGEGDHRANGDGQAGDPGEKEGITKEYEEKSLATETGGEGEFSA